MAVDKEEGNAGEGRGRPADLILLCPQPEWCLWHCPASLDGNWGWLEVAFSQQEGSYLPGGGTPEARHSKFTEAFSSTAFLTRPGSILGGTRGDEESPGLEGVQALGGSSQPPQCPSPAFPRQAGQQGQPWRLTPREQPASGAPGRWTPDSQEE